MMAIDIVNPSGSTYSSISSNPSTDCSHPLYLYPSDTPGTVLVSVLFTGIGYGEGGDDYIIVN